MKKKRELAEGATELLIRELEKILEPRQKSIEEIKRRFGFLPRKEKHDSRQDD